MHLQHMGDLLLGDLDQVTHMLHRVTIPPLGFGALYIHRHDSRESRLHNCCANDGVAVEMFAHEVGLHTGFLGRGGDGPGVFHNGVQVDHISVRRDDTPLMERYGSPD